MVHMMSLIYPKRLIPESGTGFGLPAPAGKIHVLYITTRTIQGRTICNVLLSTSSCIPHLRRKDLIRLHLLFAKAESAEQKLQRSDMATRKH